MWVPRFSSLSDLYVRACTWSILNYSCEGSKLCDVKACSLNFTHSAFHLFVLFILQEWEKKTRMNFFSLFFLFIFILFRLSHRKIYFWNWIKQICVKIKKKNECWVGSEIQKYNRPIFFFSFIQNFHSTNDRVAFWMNRASLFKFCLHHFSTALYNIATVA
jgi:hypothetical protein